MNAVAHLQNEYQMLCEHYGVNAEDLMVEVYADSIENCSIDKNLVYKKFLKDVVEMQERYKKMSNGRGAFTKKMLCDLVVPFRDMYKLTDMQALNIARGHTSLKELLKLADKV